MWRVKFLQRYCWWVKSSEMWCCFVISQKTWICLHLLCSSDLFIFWTGRVLPLLCVISVLLGIFNDVCVRFVVEHYGCSLHHFMIIDLIGRSSPTFSIGRTLWMFLKVVRISYTLCWGKTLSLYWAHKTLVTQPLLHRSPIGKEPQPFVLPYCKSTAVQQYFQSHRLQLTIFSTAIS
jgi:hypothetical protein